MNLWGYRSLLRESLPDCRVSGCVGAVVFKKSIIVSGEVERLDEAVWIILIGAELMTKLGSLSSIERVNTRTI